METRLGPLTIVGKELRTTNDNAQAFTDIPTFWEKFYQDGTIEKIPHKVTEDIYAIYTNFAHEGIDNMGVYSFIIGCQVHAGEHPPEGLVSVELPRATYAVFSSEPGRPEKIVETWQKIWQLSESRKTYMRSTQTLPMRALIIWVFIHLLLAARYMPGSIRRRGWYL
jgi:predicted transcriptional regulator YdeE